jgi:hypothetical protein
VVLTGHACNDEISSRFSVVLRPYGRSRRMRSKPLNFIALAFYLRNSHPLDFLTLFGKDFASGYVEGRDIALEVRNAEGYSQRLGALAKRTLRALPST